MNSSNGLLSEEERATLNVSVTLDVGSYGYTLNRQPFVVGLDARPLVALIDAASMGSRVYEFMTIDRPADIFHYLFVSYIDLGPDVAKAIKDNFRRAGPYENPTLDIGLSLVKFDSCFHWSGDDTADYESKWLTARGTDFWKLKPRELLKLVKDRQRLLRNSDDYLIRHEITLIDQCIHRRDDIAHIDRPLLLENRAYTQSKLDPELFQCIAALIKSTKVNSVSCPLYDFPLWRLLVTEQIKRSVQTGKPLKEALKLSCGEGSLLLTGADTRAYANEAEDWGGEVHVPYEGACEADLFVMPMWHNFDMTKVGVDGSLLMASYWKTNRYLLSRRDYGEIGCAARSQVGDWFLYEGND